MVTIQLSVTMFGFVARLTAIWAVNGNEEYVIEAIGELSQVQSFVAKPVVLPIDNHARSLVGLFCGALPSKECCFLQQ